MTEDTTIAPEKLPPSGFIRGRVMDSSGHAIPFATVKINPKQGIEGDFDGYFVINANSLRDNQLLTISAIGFQTIQVPVSKIRADGRLQASPVVLQLVSTVLGETVVVVRHSKRAKPFSDTLALIKDSLTHLGLATTTMKVFPNPVPKGNSITVSAKLDQPGIYLVQLFNLSGVLIEALDVNGQEKSGNICINIPASLTSGIYVVRVSHPAVKKDYCRQIVVL
jgi:CarboxypepD_reg-like domain/Secretion system C-terminal sorting domain